MDILKQELLKKRQRLVEETGGKKFFNRAELEKKRLQKIREEEKQEAEAKALRQKQQNGEGGNPNSDSNLNSDSSKSKNDAASSPSKTLADEQKIDGLNLPRQEVIRRLRFLKQPVTLFGEDDEVRLERLRFVLKAGLFEVDDSDMTEGQTSDFLRDIVELKKRQKSGMMTLKIN